MHVTGVLRISHEARRPRGGVITIIRPRLIIVSIQPDPFRPSPGAGLTLSPWGWGTQSLGVAVNAARAWGACAYGQRSSAGSVRISSSTMP